RTGQDIAELAARRTAAVRDGSPSMTAVKLAMVASGFIRTSRARSRGVGRIGSSSGVGSVMTRLSSRRPGRAPCFEYRQRSVRLEERSTREGYAPRHGDAPWLRAVDLPGAARGPALCAGEH